MNIPTLNSTEKFDLAYLFALLLEAIQRFRTVEDEQESLELEISEDDYETILDDIYGTVEICGYSYSAGRALKELDPVAFRCGKSDYESSLDVEESEEYKELETEKEELETFIEELHEYIQKTPFGIAADYDESPADFFTTHIVSTDTVNPYDTIPVMLELFKNTVEYKQLCTMTNYQRNLNEAIMLRGEPTDNEDVKGFQDMIGEIASECMAVLNDYAPTGFRFGFGEHNGSDLGYWFEPDEAFYTHRNHMKIDFYVEHIGYKRTFTDEEDAFLLGAELMEESFVALPHTSEKTNRLMWVIYDVEEKRVLSVCHRSGTKELVIGELRRKEVLSFCSRFQYRYEYSKTGLTIHQVFDTFKQETVESDIDTRQDALEICDQLNGRTGDNRTF